jgi:hypothetical protein
MGETTGSFCGRFSVWADRHKFLLLIWFHVQLLRSFLTFAVESAFEIIPEN